MSVIVSNMCLYGYYQILQTLTPTNQHHVAECNKTFLFQKVFLQFVELITNKETGWLVGYNKWFFKTN